MAIKVIRICDLCGAEHEQIIPKEMAEYNCPVDFECSDCILESAIISEQEANGFVDSCQQEFEKEL